MKTTFCITAVIYTKNLYVLLVEVSFEGRDMKKTVVLIAVLLLPLLLVPAALTLQAPAKRPSVSLAVADFDFSLSPCGGQVKPCGPGSGGGGGGVI
jgi:hypothetical protein